MEGAEVDGAEVNGAEVNGAEVNGMEVDGAEVDGEVRRQDLIYSHTVPGNILPLGMEV